MITTETVIDPLGNEVLLPQHFYELSVSGTNVQEVYDKPTRVIEAPAMMLQVYGTTDETYYLRSIGWESLLLIGTQKVNGKWSVHLIVNNPTSQQFRDIYKKDGQVNLIDCKSYLCACR